MITKFFLFSEPVKRPSHQAQRIIYVAHKHIRGMQTICSAHFNQKAMAALLIHSVNSWNIENSFLDTFVNMNIEPE
jgi:hypothetical protein